MYVKNFPLLHMTKQEAQLSPRDRTTRYTGG